MESIKVLISPNSFRLVEYKDEIDYLNLENDYEAYENFKKQNKSFRQNYLNYKQSQNDEKKIEIFTSFFNNRFHIFENTITIEEFIKYDGLHYLCLILEYYYQILCKLNESNNNQNKESNIDIKAIYERIENNIYDLFEFFVDRIIVYENLCENFIKEINHFLYQIVITIKKYMMFNFLNKKYFNLILSLLNILINYIRDESMNESYKYMNEIKKLRNKILDLLQNTLLIFNDENIFIENLDLLQNTLLVFGDEKYFH